MNGQNKMNNNLENFGAEKRLGRSHSKAVSASLDLRNTSQNDGENMGKKKDCFPLKFGGYNSCLGCQREQACKKQYMLLVEGYQESALEDLEIAQAFDIIEP